jgi:hypothetical protein
MSFLNLRFQMPTTRPSMTMIESEAIIAPWDEQGGVAHSYVDWRAAVGRSRESRIGQARRGDSDSPARTRSRPTQNGGGWLVATRHHLPGVAGVPFQNKPHLCAFVLE